MLSRLNDRLAAESGFYNTSRETYVKFGVWLVVVIPWIRAMLTTIRLLRFCKRFGTMNYSWERSSSVWTWMLLALMPVSHKVCRTNEVDT